MVRSTYFLRGTDEAAFGRTVPRYSIRDEFISCTGDDGARRAPLAGNFVGVMLKSMNLFKLSFCPLNAEPNKVFCSLRAFSSCFSARASLTSFWRRACSSNDGTYPVAFVRDSTNRTNGFFWSSSSASFSLTANAF